MTASPNPVPAPLHEAKFRDPLVTAKGERRAAVSLGALRTLWFNTGTLCNLTCAHCYIESSPRNDATAARPTAGSWLEAAAAAFVVSLMASTMVDGRPFVNPG